MGGNKIGSEFQVNTFDQLQHFSSISSLSNGNFVIAWQSITHENNNNNLPIQYGIFAQIYNENGEKISQEIQIAKPSKFKEEKPHVET